LQIPVADDYLAEEVAVMVTHVKGENKGNLFLFALSTCIWCKKTKKFLDDNNIEYRYVFMDELSGSEKEEMRGKLQEWNTDCSYPTLVFNNKKCVVGYDEDAIRKELK
jgi:glutaredoxin